MRWEKSSLETICQKVTDGTHDSPKTQETGMPFIKGTQVKNGRIDFNSCDYISYEDHLKVIARSHPQLGDTLLANIGANVGECALIREDLEFSIKNVALFKPDKRIINPDFLYYALANPEEQKRLLAKTAGAAQPFLSLTVLRAHAINYPPLPTQKKIASILSAYDDLIENNQKRIKLLEEAAQNIYKEWFVHFRFPGHEAVPINAETGLPEGWAQVPIGDYCVVNAESITKKNAPESIKYIDISSTQSGYFEEPTEMLFNEAPSRARRILHDRDCIFSTVRPNRKIYAFILEPEDNLIASTGFAVLTPNQSEDFPYIYLSISDQSFIDRVAARAGGAAYPAINQSDFESMTIVVPKREIIKEFDEHVFTMLKQINLLLNKNSKLKEARDILLPRLMNRTIEV